MPNRIKLNGIISVHQSEIKYVGIVFDEFLTFNSQIKNMNTKLKRANNLISISRHYTGWASKFDLSLKIIFGLKNHYLDSILKEY